MDKKTVGARRTGTKSSKCIFKILGTPEMKAQNGNPNKSDQRVVIKTRENINKSKESVAQKKVNIKLNSQAKAKKPIWNSRLNLPVEKKKFKKPETNWREIHTQSILKMRRDRAFYTAQMQVYQEIRRENLFLKEQAKVKELKMNNKNLAQRVKRPANCAWFIPV